MARKNQMYKLTLYRERNREESYEHVYLLINKKGELSITRDDITPQGSAKLEKMAKEEKTKLAHPPISFRNLYDWKDRLFRIPFGI
ncbi:MAG: hypothetical protein NTU63_00735 [Candidatus Pacearchaeota archaeon]|nr:hypothetical protein [Candidatus Pacearchaeota archaeon]